MGKRKRSKVVKPWCWFCEREFDDESTLFNHQKAKHFKCPRFDCRRMFFTFRNLFEHAQSSHSMKLESIPNALPHRCDINDTSLDIAGMEGTSDSSYYEYEQQILGDTGPTQPKRPSYGELSEDQLRTQVAQYQAAIHSNSSFMPYQQHYSNNYSHRNYGHSHNRSHMDNWSNYTHPSISNNDAAMSSRLSETSSRKSSIDPNLNPIPPPPPPPESFTDTPPPPPPPPLELSPPPSVSATPRQPNTSPSIYSLPTPSSINGATVPHHNNRHLQQLPHGVSDTSSNLGSAVRPVSPSARDRLSSRKPSRIILVYPHEDLSPDELRAVFMSKS